MFICNLSVIFHVFHTILFITKLIEYVSDYSICSILYMRMDLLKQGKGKILCNRQISGVV